MQTKRSFLFHVDAFLLGIAGIPRKPEISEQDTSLLNRVER
jgi:hypothetical protein